MSKYRAQSWWEWIITWATILIGGPLSLALTGLIFKLLWVCVLFGWDLI